MKVFIAVILIIALSAYASNAEVSQEEFDRHVGEALGKIRELHARHANVESLTAKLGGAVKLWESGDFEGALKAINEVNMEIEEIEGRLLFVEARFYLGLAAKVLFFLSLPLLTYFGLPRVYLRIWYSSRRGWLVRSAPRR